MSDGGPRHSTKGLGWPAFACGFVPGLLQFRQGRTNVAVLAFLSCAVLFFAGHAFLHERSFFFAILAPEAGPGTSAGILQALAKVGIQLQLPELLNLPSLMVGTFLDGGSGPSWERLWRLPRDFEHVAAWLTAASGILAAIWAAEGHWQLRLRRDGGDNAPAPVVNPALAAGLSWLVPGLGHLRAGQKDKGLLLLGAVAAVFAAGLWFSWGHGVHRGNAPVWWIGQNLCGGGTLVCALLTAPLKMTQASGGFPTHFELGQILCTVAGFMNLVVMVDAYTVAERSVFGRAPAQAGAQ